MSIITTEAKVLCLSGAGAKAIHAVPLALASRIVQTDHIVATIASIISYYVVLSFEYDCHQPAVAAEVNAGVCVLWTWDILDGLVDEAPQGQPQLEVRDCQNMSARRSPPAVGQASQAFIQLALPRWVVDIAGKSNAALKDAN